MILPAGPVYCRPTPKDTVPCWGPTLVDDENRVVAPGFDAWDHARCRAGRAASHSAATSNVGFLTPRPRMRPAAPARVQQLLSPLLADEVLRNTSSDRAAQRSSVIGATSPSNWRKWPFFGIFADVLRMIAELRPPHIGSTVERLRASWFRAKRRERCVQMTGSYAIFLVGSLLRSAAREPTPGGGLRDRVALSKAANWGKLHPNWAIR